MFALHLMLHPGPADGARAEIAVMAKAVVRPRGFASLAFPGDAVFNGQHHPFDYTPKNPTGTPRPTHPPTHAQVWSAQNGRTGRASPVAVRVGASRGRPAFRPITIDNQFYGTTVIVERFVMPTVRP